MRKRGTANALLTHDPTRNAEAAVGTPGRLANRSPDGSRGTPVREKVRNGCGGHPRPPDPGLSRPSRPGAERRFSHPPPARPNSTTPSLEPPDLRAALVFSSRFSQVFRAAHAAQWSKRPPGVGILQSSTRYLLKPGLRMTRPFRQRDRNPLGLPQSGSKLGPPRNRRAAVRIVTGGKPRIHQLEQERRRPSSLPCVLPESVP